MCNCSPLQYCCCCLRLESSVRFWSIVDILINVAIFGLSIYYDVLPKVCGWFLFIGLFSMINSVAIWQMKDSETVRQIVAVWLAFYTMHILGFLCLWAFVPYSVFQLFSTNIDNNCSKLNGTADFYECSNKIIRDTFDQVGEDVLMIFIAIVVLTLVNMYYAVAVNSYHTHVVNRNIGPQVIPLVYRPV